MECDDTSALVALVVDQYNAPQYQRSLYLFSLFSLALVPLSVNPALLAIL
jgi:hypothetical protein